MNTLQKLLLLYSGGQAPPEFTDDFSGTVINTAKWAETDPESVISQNDKLIIASGGSGGFSTNYLQSVPTFAPAHGDILTWQHGTISGVAITRFGNAAVGSSDAQAELSAAESNSYWRPVTNFIQLRKAWANGDWAAWLLFTNWSIFLHKLSAASVWTTEFVSDEPNADFGQTNAKITLGRNLSTSSGEWEQVTYDDINPSLYAPVYDSAGSVAAGTQISIPADGFIWVLWTASASAVLDFAFRWETDTDALSLRLQQADTGTNTALRIIRRNGGDSTVANPVTTLTAGVQYRVFMRVAGSSITGWIKAASGGAMSSIIRITETHNQSIAAAKLIAGTADDIKVFRYEN